MIFGQSIKWIHWQHGIESHLINSPKGPTPNVQVRRSLSNTFFQRGIWFNMDPERVGNHKFPSHLQGAPSVWKKLKACGLRLDGWNKKRWQGIYSAHITEKYWKVMWRCWKCVLMQPIWLWPLWHMTKETQDDSSVSYRSYPLCHWRSMSSENGDEWNWRWENVTWIMVGSTFNIVNPILLKLDGTCLSLLSALGGKSYRKP